MHRRPFEGRHLVFICKNIGRKHKYPDFILDKAYNKALTTFNADKAISREKIVATQYSCPTISSMFAKFGSFIQN